GDFPYYYGYQITIGPDGRPKINEFGNVKLGSKGLVEQNGVREPLVDKVLNKKQNMLTITAEMPGIDKENINVNVTGAARYVACRERGQEIPCRYTNRHQLG